MAKMQLKHILSVLTFCALAKTQGIAINTPQPGDTLTAGSDFSMEVQQPVRLRSLFSPLTS